MLYRALSISLLFSFYSHTADQKNSDQLISEAGGKYTTKPPITGITSIAPTPKIPKGPELAPQFPGTNQPSSSEVGSTAGGSIINLLSDLLRVEQPDIDKLRREKQVADFQASLQKYGEHTTAQFYPDLYEKYMRTKNPMPIGFAPESQSPLVVHPTPAFSAPKAAPVATPIPTAALVVSAPAVVTSTTLVGPSVTGLQLPGLPAAAQIKMPTMPTQGGVQPLPTMNQLMAPKSYIKPLPVPTPAPQAPSVTSEEAGGMAAVGAFIIAKAPVVAAVGALVGIGYLGYKGAELTGRGVESLIKWWNTPTVVNQIEKKAVDVVAHRTIHETVHTPKPTPTHTPATQPHITPHATRAPHLQPSQNPLELGHKPWQPGPKPGQGDRPHNFGDRPNHYRDYTPENVQRTLDTVNLGTYHGQDPANGNHVFTQICPETGLQKYAYTDNTGKILNSGINDVPHLVNPNTKKLTPPPGYKKPEGSGRGKVMVGAGVLLAASSSSSAATMSQVAIGVPRLPDAPVAWTVEDVKERELSEEKAIGFTLAELDRKLIASNPHITSQDRNRQISTAEGTLRNYLRKQDL